ncbi:MAG: hypothetical protein UHS41_00105 [Lachnospiraceae bacterium]|nr:hypothetical protein [Lachnospiraceae bacterium]
MKQDWMNDARVRNIPPEKLTVMALLMEQANGKTPEEFLPILLRTSQSLEKAGMSFTKEETNLIIDVLKEGMTPAEKQKLAFLQSLMK